MATSHKLVKTNQVGLVLVEELSRNTQGGRDILEVTKQASECFPDRMLPEPDLKTMREVFDEKLLETEVIDAFEPYRDEQPGNNYDPKNQVIYNVNYDYMANGVGSVAVEGTPIDGEVTPNAMVNFGLVAFNDFEGDNQTNYELISSSNEKYESVRILSDGIYCFTGEFSLQIHPADIQSYPQNANIFNPPNFIRGGDDEIKYRITLQQFVGTEDPYDEEYGVIPFTIIDSYLLGEGAFSKLDIVKGERRQVAFNVILRANARDRFRVYVERSRVIGIYPDTEMRDALFFAKVGEDSNDPYFQNRDHSNYIRFICLVGTTPET